MSSSPWLHLKEVVLTDRPLRQCQSMKGMNEQSDLIVLTLELKEQKRVCEAVADMRCGEVATAETSKKHAAASLHTGSYFCSFVVSENKCI